MSTRLLPAGFILATLFLHACGESKKKTPAQDAVKAATVNTAFESNPPIATSINVRALKEPINGNNVLLTATFPRGVIKDNLHAIVVNDETLTLRDDGSEGDEQADDGIFSIAINEDLNALKEDLIATQTANVDKLNRKEHLFRWSGRSATVIDNQVRETNVRNLDFEKGAVINPELFKLIPDPELRERSLMITDLGVIEDPTRTFNPCTRKGDPDGVWTFGHLITQMANTPATGISVNTFLQSWLEKWMAAQIINGDNVAARTNIFSVVILPWLQASNPGAIINTGNWKTFKFNLSLAPFRLLAIVNRLDLRGNSGYKISNAGEGRFVFSVLGTNCNPLRFTTILEYGIPKRTCKELHDFAQQWWDLKALVPGTPAYNDALQKITDQFTAAGTSPSKPNGSSLNQLRTNEIALARPWELREFKIGEKGLFEEVTVKQEPALKFNRLSGATLADQQVLAVYANNNEPDILNQTYVVPDIEPISVLNFLGGKSQMPVPAHFWDAATAAGPARITNDTVRHILSVNTCSGCHAGEAKTSVGNLINDPAGIPHASFLQIAPQPFGTKPTLSAFLTGDPSQADGLFRVTDPAGRPTGSPIQWTFNDLARRAEDLQLLLKTECGKSRLVGIVRALSFRPLNFTH
ncbi:choice-of-anchor X domain-containing protein [Chitinophaga ginsengisoli]|uniref:Cytochrome c domain-containing protein n=1 Tax=Chitinophaga ginsengisoli TaxID=363837 RepID=A0A2P8G7B9_9BACT|nr:choice-of-anchor X domain-containing protein [Chitinophaga ginsengisoli]PSL29864.1 hypothetical protein CLV42_106199 [Chitinophaga ginsengisoli]